MVSIFPAAYSTLGLHIHDQEFRYSLRYWLGVPLFGNVYQCPECGLNADIMGDHQVGCGGNGDRISCHKNIRDVLFNAAQTAALGPRKEAPGMVPNSSARPANILLPNWCRGRQAALDVAVISSLQRLTVAEAAVTPGHALEVCVRCKLSTNLPSCRAAGVECVPMVVEALGGWAPGSISTIRRIGDFLGQRLNPLDPSHSTKHLFAWSSRYHPLAWECHLAHAISHLAHAFSHLARCYRARPVTGKPTQPYTRPNAWYLLTCAVVDGAGWHTMWILHEAFSCAQCV